MSERKQQSAESVRAGAPKKAWEPPGLSYIGDIADIVRSGGGKLSISGGDPGESRKQRSSG